MNSGDTAWLLVSAGLVMLMTPALALFYGGMVQGKNVLSTFMHSFFALGIVSLQFAILGYSLCFGPSWHGLIGGLDYLALDGVGGQAFDRTHQFPMLAHFAYQCMFAVIAPALISGAYAERMKFSAYVLFTLGWTTLVYDPIAHWSWQADGWLAQLGAIDFAGGTVVHLSSGASALVCALVLGKRRGYPAVRHPPHDLTMTVVGAGILWFGWFGFNAGSALKADGLAALALVNTHLAAAAGALTWVFTEGFRVRKTTMLGVASGLVAGLVAITPAAGYVSPMVAIAIGAAAGMICYGGVLLKTRLGYDDALDAFGVHGVGGATGALLTGVFARAVLNNGHGGGLDLLQKQVTAVVAAGAWAVVMTLGLLKVIQFTVGLRVDQETEHDGLDGALHGESAYGSPGGVAHGS
ncbi:MAG TPA: ammonium transporter [Kofleriaceae bacterium]|jgi:Amt family ammonium transporter|nr:ammonium transporter [Kofleriaceae bacterium]